MLKTFIASSNMRNILTSPRLPPSLSNCSAMFHKLVRTKNRNTLTTEMLSTHSWGEDIEDHNSEPHTMDAATFKALQTIDSGLKSQEAYFHDRIERDQVTFAKADANLGDSLVMVSDPGSSPFPASIQALFVVDNGTQEDTYISFQRYQPLSADEPNPFQRYPIFGAKLWSSHLSAVLEVQPLSRVVGHFTRKAHSRLAVVVTPLRK